MNWLGAGVASLLSAIIGAVVGAFIHFEARRRGVDFPPLVGIVAGLAAALVSRERSNLRGALVASLSVWAAALAEVLAAPTRGVFPDIATFHTRLGLARSLSYAACALVAALLASRAIRRSARSSGSVRDRAGVRHGPS